MSIYKLVLILFISLFMCAQTRGEPQAITVIKPEQFAISNNIVFVVDASSTMFSNETINKRFNMAWNHITNKFAMDELYFCVYIFHDKGHEKFRKWVNAGGRGGKKEFDKAKSWILNNKGVYSWGANALGKGLREINPLNKNWSQQGRLTVILITDGGLTEAARYVPKTGKNYFKPIYDVVVNAQKWRLTKNLAPASILTVGIQNEFYWSSSVKRPDSECQRFLRILGKKYGGGYVFIKN